MKTEVSSTLPWLQGHLRAWSISGMNHYHVDGKRFLFVAMVKDGRWCIQEEGPDDERLWDRLQNKARPKRKPLDIH
jgi:hypothetical protein